VKRFLLLLLFVPSVPGQDVKAKPGETATLKAIDNRVFAHLARGSDPCQKIINAAQSLPSTGGTVDSSGFEGDLTNCASGDLRSIGKPVLILQGASTLNLNSPLRLPNKSVWKGIGRGDSGPGGGMSAIRASSEFPTSGPVNGGTPLIDLSGGTFFYGSLRDVTLDCNGVTNCVGYYATDIQEQAGLEHVAIVNFPNVGMYVNACSKGAAQNYTLSQIELLPGRASTPNTIDSWLCGDEVYIFEGITANGGKSAIGVGFKFQSMTKGDIIGTHAERATVGYLIDHAFVNLMSPQCGGPVSMTDCVKIVGASGFERNVSITQLNNSVTPGKLTNLINDTVSGVVISTAECHATATISQYTLTENGNWHTDSVCPAPVIVAGFNDGMIGPNPNGTRSFTVTVGGGEEGSTGVIGFPPAPHGWNCFATDESHPTNFIPQTANSRTSCTLTNYGARFSATKWTNGDTLNVIAQER